MQRVRALVLGLLHETPERLMRAVDRSRRGVRRGHGQHDDVTVLVLRMLAGDAHRRVAGAAPAGGQD